MAFFRKWKTHYKHKKFTSDDVVDAEDWGLDDKSVKFNCKANDILKLQLDQVKCSANCDDNDDKVIHDDDTSGIIFQKYDIKYLGCTPIDNKLSEMTISKAIKTVITNAKAGSRRIKYQKRVKLIVSNSGLEVLDHINDESLMCFSIYKISYCSVNASYDHAFSFVASECDILSNKEKMLCHAFLCPKRKIAHEITLLVARCFETAYQNWRDTVLNQVKSRQTKEYFSNHINKSTQLNEIECKADLHYQYNEKRSDSKRNTTESTLIDLTPVHPSNSDMHNCLQNDWVSFDDESKAIDTLRITAY